VHLISVAIRRVSPVGEGDQAGIFMANDLAPDLAPASDEICGYRPFIGNQITRTAPNLSSAPGDGSAEQKRDQQRAERRFARNVAENAERHPRLPAGVYRTADAVDSPLHGVRNLRDGGFGLRGGIKAFVDEGRRRGFVAHGCNLLSTAPNGPKRESFPSSEALMAISLGASAFVRQGKRPDRVALVLKLRDDAKTENWPASLVGNFHPPFRSRFQGNVKLAEKFAGGF
jgi:hypothetical protein